MPPDNTPGGRPDKTASRTNSTPAGASHHGNRRACDQCGKPLTARRRRFCSDRCRVKGQKSERVIENRDYANGIVRLIRRMGTRADGDLDALRSLAEMIDRARDTLALAVDGCRARGYSDGEIGQALGISRQAVWKRFSRQPKVDAGIPGAGASG